MSDTTEIAGGRRIARGPQGPQRVEPLPQDALCPRSWETVLRLRRATNFPLDAPVEPFFATFGHHPGLFDGFMRLGSELLGPTALAPRDKELAILRASWLCDAPFQWGEHVAKARTVGLDEAEIARVREGACAPGWSERDRALLRAVEELHADAGIGDATWAELAQWFDAPQLVELPVLVGHYHMTAFFHNALRVRPTRDGDGQPLPDTDAGA